MKMILNISLSLILLSFGAYAQQSDLSLLSKVQGAIAVTGAPGRGYYVLTSDKAVYHYTEIRAGRLSFAGRFDLQAPGKGIDIAFARVDQQDSVLVAQWAGSTFKGAIYRYSPDGKVIRVWKTGHMPGGIYFDPTRRQAFFGTFDSHELYRIDLNAADPQFVLDVFGARQLGPITFDPDRQIIYVADTQGTLYSVDPHTRKVAQLSSSFGLVSALFFESRSQLVYVADRVQKKIFAVNPSTKTIRSILQSAKITSPSGLTAGQGNSLIISDESSGGIFLKQLGTSSAARIPPQRPAAAKKESRGR